MDFLASAPALDWVKSFGSPLHIVFPEIAATKAEEWRTSLSTIYSNVDVRFALKSCKSSALVNTFGSRAIGADCSSLNEVLQAVENAVAPSKISLTGPHKSDREYRMAVALGVAIHIDAPDIASRLGELGRGLGRAPKAVLRLRPPSQEKSRFGMSPIEALEIGRQLCKTGCELEGISFHLNGYSTAERVDAALLALEIIATLKDEGLSCRSLDIGGGFPVNYLADPEYERSIAAMPRWGSKPTPVTYPYYNDVAGNAAAEAILKAIFTHKRAAEIIESTRLQIVLQPGRALVDQSGISLFSVIGRKKTATDLSILVLDGMSFSISERWFGSDFLPSPLLLTREGISACTGAEYALAGNSCLEDDLIRQISVGFDAVPNPGDALVFINTAGYQMDSNESGFHQRRLPRKVAAVCRETYWLPVLDEEFTWRS